jgi:hypothetical protein
VGSSRTRVAPVPLTNAEAVLTLTLTVMSIDWPLGAAPRQGAPSPPSLKPRQRRKKNLADRPRPAVPDPRGSFIVPQENVFDRPIYNSLSHSSLYLGYPACDACVAIIYLEL